MALETQADHFLEISCASTTGPSSVIAMASFSTLIINFSNVEQSPGESIRSLAGVLSGIWSAQRNGIEMVQMQEATRLFYCKRRSTAATNTLDREANITKVQEWLRHASIATTCIYGQRKMRPEDRAQTLKS